MQLIEKLKQRKIVQWSAGYFAVAWGLLEVLSFLSNQFTWPSFVVRSATVIVGIGFFIALTLAWHHGDKGRQRVNGIELATLAVIVVAGGILMFIVNLPKSDELEDLRGLGSDIDPVTRMTIALPREQRLGIAEGDLPLAVAPNGKRVAYIAETGQGVHLAVRPFDSFEATVLNGTEGAMQPFFSPDGEWIGFFTLGEMRKVPVRGGEPITITAFEGYPAGASWGSDDSILYSHWRQGLWIVPSSGGSPRKVELVASPASNSASPDTAPQAIGNALEWPSFLPGSEHAVVTSGSSVILVNSITGESSELIATAGREARYLRSGFLVFTESGEHLRAVAFDTEKLQITGQPFPVLDDVFRGPGRGAVFFDISRNGTLVYVTGGFERSLTLADRNGRMRAITEDRRGFRWPRFSPQGDRIVVTVDPRPSEFWIYELARGFGEKISAEGHNILPIWQTESGNIVHFRRRALRSIDPDNLDQAELLYPEDASIDRAFFPTTSTFNDRIIAGNGWNADTGVDIYTLTIGDSPILEAYLRSPADEREPDISPDGKWIAYASNMTGRNEVYVQAFSGPPRRARISRDGGDDPQWSDDGRKLFYRHRDYIMVVNVDAASDNSYSEPLVHLRTDLDMTQMRNWDVGPDDQIVLVESDPTTTREFQVVLNWFKAVQELAD